MEVRNSRAPSAMPLGGQVLNRSELRELLEFLSTLK